MGSREAARVPGVMVGIQFRQEIGTCGNCHQPGCWNARSSCYRCGAPRYQEQGVTGQVNTGARDMEGEVSREGWGWHGGLSSGWTQWERSDVHPWGETLRRGEGLSRVGRAKTRWVETQVPALVLVLAVVWAVVGVAGIFIPGWEVTERGTPLPPGIVPSEGERAQSSMDFLNFYLKEGQEVEQFMSFFRGRISAVPEPAPAQTPAAAGWVGEAGEGWER